MLCNGLPVKTYSENTYVIKEGSNEGKLYILKSGNLLITKQSDEGENVIIGLVKKAGSVFGEVSVLTHVNSMATVRTTDTCEFYVIENAEEYIETHPALCAHIAKLLARRLSHVTERLYVEKANAKAQAAKAAEEKPELVNELLQTTVLQDH